MPTLTVATFNVHHCRGLDGRIDIGRIATTIAGTGAELVGLQELDRGMARSGRVDQPEALAERLGYAVDFFATLERDGEYGIGVAAVGRPEVEFRSLERVGDEEPRGVIVARWRGVSLLVTHLSRHPAARELQTQQLADVAREVDPPVVVMGDLNQGRDDLGPLAAAGLAPSPRRLHTLAKPWRRGELDHVLAGRGARVVSARTVRSLASDHRPVVASIEADV